MRTVAAVAIFAAIINVTVAVPAVTQAMIDRINSDPTVTWRAGYSKPFEAVTTGYAQKYLGTIMNEESKKLIDEVRVKEDYDYRSAPLPASFTWRGRAVGNRTECLGPVLDQGPCGSCWAHGAASSITARFCIASGGKVLDQISPANIMECDQTSNGCDGGMLASAFDFVRDTGAVDVSCVPYPFPGCGSQPCLPPFKPTPACTHTCSDGKSFSGSKKYISKYYSPGGWFDREKKIMEDIVNNGPVEASFTVYQDFLAYKDGVYKHVTGQMLGGHAIMIVGFGVSDSGVKYWECQNSWSTQWASDGGFFKIERGVDECGIEGNIVAGIPKF